MYVAASVRHRKALQQLDSLDGSPQADSTRIRTGPGQEGAFIKFDITKGGNCPICKVPDPILHWYTCEQFAEIRAQFPGLVELVQECPQHTLVHLLVSRSPHTYALRRLCLRHKALNFSLHLDVTFSMFSQTAAATSTALAATLWLPGASAMQPPDSQ